MTRFQQFFWFSLPIALLAFAWLSLGTTASFSDEARTLYGFPLPWYAKSQVTSLGYDVALGPMLLDFLLYLGLSHLVIHLLSFVLPPKNGPKSKKIRAICALLWLTALLSTALFCFALAMDVQLNLWTLDNYFGGNAQRQYFFQFGLGNK